MERRDFLKKAGMTAAGALATTAGLAACAQEKQEEAKAPEPKAAAMPAKKTFEWKMVTTWPPNLPVLQTGAERFAKRVEEATGGQLKIQVFAGGELVPPLGVFDAVSEGTVECGSGA
ncbi:MAG: twin-arginine translocation signal domain-containing protein, partial [Desulfobacterales bacterium]